MTSPETAPKTAPKTAKVDNDYYHALGERWFTADDDPIALLRAESLTKNPWVIARLESQLGKGPKEVLDIGCGAGFLCRDLADAGHSVTGLDASEQSLAAARSKDPAARIRYTRGDALKLPFADASFDAVCAMDFLEHVENPAAAILEASRVLRPGGIFFFHTFNRNWLSWLVVIQAVRFLVPNTPRHLHVLRLFIKPRELVAYCEAARLATVEIRGLEPRLFSVATLKLLLSRRVPADFGFEITQRTWAGYIGFSRRLLSGGSLDS